MKKKSVIDALKFAGSLVISVGVGTVVGDAVKSTSPSNLGAVKKVLVCLGTLVLTDMFTDMATQYTMKKIDDTVSEVKEGIEEAKKALEQPAIEAE